MKKFAHLALAAALTLYAGLASAATFNLFQPANGILVGNPSTYITTAATSSNVIALWSGTCNSTTFLRGDGSCQAVTSVSPANPTASVGLTAVNGSAGTFMRSDAAPPISQSIAPTWTGNHTFTTTPILSAAAPTLRFTETDAPANNGVWDIRAQAEQLQLRAVDDAISTASNWATVDRTGTTVDNVSLLAPSGSINLSGASSTVTVGNSGITAIAGLSTSAQLLNTDVNPSLYLNETDAAADEKLYRMNIAAGDLIWSTRTDANGSGSTFFQVARTGTTVDTLTATATTINLNGSVTSPQTMQITGPSVQVINAGPRFLQSENDQGADGKIWDEAALSGVMTYRTRTDADGAGQSWLTVARSGTTVGVVGFPSNAGITVGAPAGGAQGNGTINATGLFVNGVAVGVGSGDAVLANTQTFTGNNTFTNTGNNVQGTVPQWGWRETGATADEGNWLLRADGDQFNIHTATDAAPTSAAATAMSIARSGTTPSSIDFLSSTVQLTNSGFVIGNSASPRFTLNETDAAVDNRLWRIGTSSETLVWGTRNDADNAGSDFFTVDRTGTTVDRVSFPVGPSLFGADTNIPALGSPGSAIRISAVGTAAQNLPAMAVSRWTADASGPYFVFGKSRGTTVGSFTVVQSGDVLGSAEWVGADGADGNSVAGSIAVSVDGTPGSNDMPGRMAFSTTADGAAAPTERMFINNAGLVGITGKDAVVGGTAAGGHAAANRTVLNVNGVSDVAVDLSVGGSFEGYLYASATAMRVAGATGNDLDLYSNDAVRLSIDTDGSWDMAGSTPGTSGQVLTSNGSGSAPTWQTPGAVGLKFAFMANVNGASGCSIGGGQSGITSCTWNSTGNYTVNYTAASFATAPACTVAGTNAGLGSLANVQTTTTTSVTVTFNTAVSGNALQDVSWRMICVGT